MKCLKQNSSKEGTWEREALFPPGRTTPHLTRDGFENYVENILRDGRVGKGSSFLLFLFSFSKTPWQLGARGFTLGKVTKNQEF